MEPLSKQLQAAADLDLARCQGKWETVAELAKRFKKYHPDETVLPAVACIEAEFSRLVDRSRARQETSLYQPLRSSRRVAKMGESTSYNISSDGSSNNSSAPRATSTIYNNYSSTSIARLSISPDTWIYRSADDEFYRHDTPEHISIPTHLEQSQVTDVLQRLQALIQKYTKPQAQELLTNDEWQAQLAKIVLARVYFEVGQYDKALISLDKLALQMQHVHSGYGMVLLIQARVIKGTCLEVQNKISAAIDAYEAAWRVYEQHPLEKGQILWDWIEEALYRAILLVLRVQGQPHSALRLMRGYMHLATSSWSSYWRMHKRWIVFENYGYYLAKVVQERTYPPMAISDTPYPKSTSGNATKKTSAFEELLCLTALCRNLFSSISSKLSPEEQADYAEKLSALFVHAHDIIGWGPISNIRRVLQFLQHAREKTFNSLSIARHIFLALARLGNFDEALIAFKGYMGLAGISDIDKLADLDIPADDLACQIRSRLRTLPRSHETELDVLRALNVGVKLYGRMRHDGTTAASVADVAMALFRSLKPPSEQDDNEYYSILVQTYRTHGSAYGLLAFQCYDPEIRALSNAKSIESLTEAAGIGSSRDAWRTYYELAVQQAQMRNIEQAIRSISQSLKIEPTHLPSWNLLVLLYSCQHQFHKTLETIRAYQDNYYDAAMPHNVPYGLPAFSLFDNNKDGQYYFDKAEAYVRLRMFQLLILQQTEGPIAASKLYSDLFAIYHTFAGNLGMSQAHTTYPSSDQLEHTAPTEHAKPETESSVRPTSTISNGHATLLPALGPSHTSEDLQIEPKVSRPRRKSMGFLDLRRRSSSNPTPVKHVDSNDVSRESRHQSAKVPSKRTLPHDIPSKPSAISNVLPSSFTPSFSIPHHRPIFVASSGKTCFLEESSNRWKDMLVDLWVMSIDTYLKAHRFEEASKGLLEVEKLGPEDPKVWHQLGRYFSTKSTDAESLRVAVDAYEKSLMLDPDHVDTHIDMASTYMKLGEREVAEALLERTVHGAGWDSGHAWLLLGTIYKDQGNYEQAKKCFLYASDLCDTSSLNSSVLSKLPRFI
ncbi:hypothetical protein BX666DRAFT_1460783 [Dichotomocladium elegans]|nr:hypothetical protein BX666DRAFT_1460783 [Dichotomocladium elegans]